MTRSEPQMTVLAERTPLHVPDLHLFSRDDLHYAVHAEAPNWVALDARGREVLDVVREAGASGTPISFGGLVSRAAPRS